ncbi:golgin subfamily A member 5-like [Leguminivora glycinivorella]|uniref:golgin subfamily A member 5-like n=1 Tax=Leguminivora glycinivorella TaxID=1035111 RepID=UPI00200E2B26|nr:golgin subfamily A member 5-like [Leguminivora glycinivorella]
MSPSPESAGTSGAGDKVKPAPEAPSAPAAEITTPETKKAQSITQKAKTKVTKPPVTETSTVPTKKYVSRLSEAKANLDKANERLKESGNIKTIIKVEVKQALERLYALVKEAEAELARERGKGTNATKPATPTEPEDKTAQPDPTLEIESREKDVRERFNKMEEYMKENERRMIESERRQSEHIKKMDELKIALEEHKENMKGATYASVTATRPNHPQRSTLHSVVVTSTDETETGEAVLEKVRKTVDAKDGWIRVEKVRKAKDRKVIMGFETTEERKRHWKGFRKKEQTCA